MLVMPTAAPPIHKSAVITGDVTLGEQVSVGPHCVIDGTIAPITIGDGCRLIAQVYLTGPLTLGSHNTLWPGAALGGPPQDVNYDPAEPGSGLVIGDHNVFREAVSVHRSKADQPTRIGHHNYFMATSHVGHDSVLGDRIQLANGALVAGHVHMGDRVILGGNSGVHQFCRVGSGAMIQGAGGASMDVPPWCIVAGISKVDGINLIGMRRSGMSQEEIQRRRAIYKLIFRSRRTMTSVVEQLRAEGDPIALEYADFITSSQRGVCKPGDRIGRQR